jgi:hypothetical protein
LLAAQLPTANDKPGDPAQKETDMSEQNRTIGERMAARKGEAETKAKGMLWSGADADEIAAVALAGGIDPAWIDKQAAAVEAAQAAIRAAIEAQGRQHAIETELQAAQTATAKATRALTLAQTAVEDAEAAQGAIEAASAAARAAVVAAARAVQGGAIPTDRAPDFLTALVDQWTANERAAARGQAITSLERQVEWRKTRIEALQAELKAERKTDPTKERSAIGPGGFIPNQTVLAGRIKTEREALKAAKRELAAITGGAD